MRGVLGMIAMVGWLVLFALPLGLLFWAMSEGGDVVRRWTGWPLWVSVPVAIVGGVAVCGAWITTVWPRLFKPKRGDSATANPQSKSSGI